MVRRIYIVSFFIAVTFFQVRAEVFITDTVSGDSHIELIKSIQDSVCIHYTDTMRCIVDSSDNTDSVRIPLTLPLFIPQDVRDLIVPVDTSTQKKTIEIIGGPVRMPQFQGGEKALMRFLDKHVTYPPEYKGKPINGKVIVRFVIDGSGKILCPSILRSLHPILDQEALRVIQLMPDWIPASNGRKIYYTIPVLFKKQNTEDDDRISKNLRLEIILSQDTILLGEEISMTLVFTNDTDRDLYFHSEAMLYVDLYTSPENWNRGANANIVAHYLSIPKRDTVLANLILLKSKGKYSKTYSVRLNKPLLTFGNNQLVVKYMCSSGVRKYESKKEYDILYGGMQSSIFEVFVKRESE